jgi:hypothetical protein
VLLWRKGCCSFSGSELTVACAGKGHAWMKAPPGVEQPPGSNVRLLTVHAVAVHQALSSGEQQASGAQCNMCMQHD